jgi:hypothetical protein
MNLPFEISNCLVLLFADIGNSFENGLMACLFELRRHNAELPLHKVDNNRLIFLN